jgi:hypothetical protein
VSKKSPAKGDYIKVVVVGDEAREGDLVKIKVFHTPNLENFGSLRIEETLS